MKFLFFLYILFAQKYTSVYFYVFCTCLLKRLTSMMDQSVLSVKGIHVTLEELIHIFYKLKQNGCYSSPPSFILQSCPIVPSHPFRRWMPRVEVSDTMVLLVEVPHWLCICSACYMQGCSAQSVICTYWCSAQSGACLENTSSSAPWLPCFATECRTAICKGNSLMFDFIFNSISFAY